jgi:uncharacterized membrane protein YphA (DoxX/SURF4 family)
VRWLPWLGTVARLIVGGVLLVAGGLKVGNPYQAGAAVRAYRIFPNEIATVIGQALPWVEIGLGAVLVLGVMTRFAAIAAGALFLIFIAGIISAWARGLTIDCGCFGGGGDVAPGETRYLEEIIRDIGLVALSAFLAWKPRTALSVDGLTSDAGRHPKR